MCHSLIQFLKDSVREFLQFAPDEGLWLLVFALILRLVNISENCGLCLSQRHIYDIVESKMNILTIYNILYSEHLVEIGLYLLDLAWRVSSSFTLLSVKVVVVVVVAVVWVGLQYDWGIKFAA